MKTVLLTRLKEHRENAGLSQDTLAQMAGISLRTIQRIEAGGETSIETAKALSSVLSLSSYQGMTTATDNTPHSQKAEENTLGHKLSLCLFILGLFILFGGFLIKIFMSIWELFTYEPTTSLEQFLDSHSPGIGAYSLLTSVFFFMLSMVTLVISVAWERRKEITWEQYTKKISVNK